jgi:hypothetical protein
MNLVALRSGINGRVISYVEGPVNCPIYVVTIATGLGFVIPIVFDVKFPGRWRCLGRSCRSSRIVSDED